MLEEDFTHITSSPLINWQAFANANVLITGANGFLPAYMAKTLLNLNATLLRHAPCRVLALVRNYKHAREVFAPYLDPTFTKDSALGNHSGDLANFGVTADLKSSSTPKFAKSPTSTTANPRILKEDKQVERENQATNEKADSSSTILESQAKNKLTQPLESTRQDLILITHDVSEPLNLPYPIHYIIHAASPASPRFYKDAPLSVIYPNVLGTINMLNLARINPVRSFLYFSSGEVYGEFAGEIDESAYGYVDPTSLRSCYAESKRMGENLCIAYGSEYGLPVKIARPFHTYGPGMKLDDGRVFADFVRSVVMGQDIVLTSSGEAKRSFLYLADAAIAYFLILTKGVNNEAYNVANEQGIVSIKELAQIIASLFPEKGLQVRFEAPKESYMPSPIMSCAVKTDKLKALGWSPKIAIEQGFYKTIRSYL